MKTTSIHSDILTALERDPFEIFKEVRALFPRAFFLQFSQNHSPFGNSQHQQEPDLSVIGLHVEESLVVRGGKAEVHAKGDVRRIEGSLFDILNEKLSAFRSEQNPKIPFASGGAFGCIGYDIVREIEPRLKNHGYFRFLEGGQSFECEILFCRDLVVFDHQQNQVHLILSSQLAKKTTLQGLLAKEKENDRSKKASLPLPPLEAEGVLLQASLGKRRFKEAVAKLKRHILDGDIFQAVLAERFEGELQASAFNVFQILREISPAAYHFYFPFQNREFLGASPEALIRIQNGEIETHPIAGTRPRGRTPEEDLRQEKQLLASSKESAEHLMLVDLARNDIGRVSVPGTVEVKTFRQLLRLPNVMHLISKVRGKLARGISEVDAFKASFPAGTLSGAPKIRAMEILSDLEILPRGLYGGAIVAFDFQGGLESCIAIRSLEVTEGKAILRAGAGIVADSDPDSEYEEIEHKLASLRQALSIAQSVAVEPQGAVG